jgi:CDGSH-type Zn-finger protein
LSESRVSLFINPRSGSIRVRGTVDIVDIDGNILETKSDFKLCGCGLTQDAPFCDSSHKNKPGYTNSN